MRAALLLLPAVLAAACAAPARQAPARVTQDITLRPDTHLVQGVVPRNTTLDAMLRSEGLEADLVQRVVTATRSVFDPRRLRSLQPFSLERSLAGALRAFEYEIDGNSFLRIRPRSSASGELHAEVLPIPKTLENAVASGTISTATPSLFGAMTATGERPELALGIAEIFSGEIDFNTGLQADDAFTVAFERFRREGRPDSYGFITAAEFRNEGRVLRAIRFTPPGGKPGYYDEDGRSVTRFFLRSPLKFEPRITSGFSLRRMHPVLHTARAHRGVDYGAPTGAPVVAAASGTVVAAAYTPANGKYVRLRHPSGYESYYLHLSAISAGVRAGVSVGQGQTIGLVGSTGLASGPHLHYGLTRNGVFVNPLREQQNLPPGEPIAPEHRELFAAVRSTALAQLSGAASPDSVPGSTPASIAAIAPGGVSSTGTSARR